MAYLIGSSDVSAYTTDTTYNTNEYYAWRNGDTTVGVVASSSGTVNKINMYIADWNAMTSIKACLYEDNALLNSVVVPASIGTGFVSFAFPDTAVVAGSEKYKLAFYLVNGDSTLTLKTKTGDGQYREAVGSYTSPAATIGDGNWFGAQEFYWSAESGSAVTIDDEPTDVKVTESRTIQVTVPTTAITTGNTDIYIDADTNAAITPTSCTLVSGLTYDVAFIVPDAYAGLPYSTTGYPIIVDTVDGQATSANVPYLPVTGHDFITTTAVSGDLTELSGTLAIGDQIEWDTISGTVAISSDCIVTYTGADPDGISFNVRAWDDTDDTWGSYALQTFDTNEVYTHLSSGGVAPTGTGLVKSVYNWMMSGLVSITGAAKSELVIVGSTTYTHTPSGGITTSGKSKYSKISDYVLKAIGGVLSTGSALVLRGYQFLASGAVSLSGAAKQLSTRGIFGTGGVVVSGGGSQESSLDYTVSSDRVASSKEIGSSIYRTLKRTMMTIKDPDNVLDYGWDFSPELVKVDDTILTATVIVSGGISYSRLTFDTYKISAFVSGGTVGVPASVTFRINTVGGRVIDKTLYFTIKQQ